MVEINMAKEPESGLLVGINLWEVRDCKPDRSQAGDPKLAFKFKCGEVELQDSAMLVGKGWFYGRKKLIALGLAEDFVGNFDPLDFMNRRVWIATIKREWEYTDPKTGQTKRGVGIQVDGSQLKFAGYQPENDVPPGANVPGAATEAVGLDEAPF